MLHAVEEHAVRRDRTRQQFFDHDKCVVVAFYAERTRRPPQHLDHTTGVGLDPDGGRRVGDVTQHRSKDQLRHTFTPAPRGREDRASVAHRAPSASIEREMQTDARARGVQRN